MYRIALLLLAVASCDRAFSLDRDDSCPYVDLDPDADDDRDSVLNGVDACPLVAAHDPHDEDGDGIPDDCDPCAMFAAAGVDLDCDGIGAACDVDDSIPHVHEFFGFGSMRRLVLESDASITNDALHFSFPDSGSYGRGIVMTRVPAEATYELHARLTALDDDYCQHGFRIRDEDQASYETLVIRHNGLGRLEIIRENASSALASQELGALDANAELTLRLQIVGSTLTARITGVGIQTTEVTTTVAPLSGLIEYGVGAYCDGSDGKWGIDVSYLTRTALAPPL